MNAIKWFFSYLKKYRTKIIAALFLVTLSSALAVVNPFISGIVVDDVITKGIRNILPACILILIGTTLVRSICRYIYLYIFERVSQDMLYTIRDVVYRRFLDEDFRFYDKHRTGDLMSRQTGDMDAIRHFVAWVIYNVYENSLLLIFALIMFFTVEIKLALCMIAILPISILLAYFQLKNVKPQFHNIRQHFSSLNTAVQENISGNRVVKAFAKEDFEIQKFNKENDGYRDAELDSMKVWRKYVPVFEFLSSSLNVILYLVGGLMVINHSITLGNLVTVSGYLWMLNNPLRMAGWLANDYQRFVASVEKIYSTIMEEPKIKQPKKAIKLKHLNGDICFNHVFYEAHDDVILKDIHFIAHHGQTIGILGTTGSGKSTLMNLLCRFHDVTSGSITIDGNDIRKMSLYNLRSHIGMAMQDVFLFSDTIEANIAYCDPDAQTDDVIEVAKIANAHQFIEEMPDGYHTIVGERGVGLSGGQKQRISLARALMKDPSILILDDTTSAVDMETEQQIQQDMKAVAKNRTVFIIAQRISSVMEADQILVLDHGCIIESGTHKELLRKQGYYATVFEHQYGRKGGNE